MDFEPVLLEASLGAILYLFTLTFGTAVKWYKLLFELTAVPLHKAATLILFAGLLQRAHFIFALAYVNYFVVGWLRDLLPCGWARISIEIILQMRSSII